MSSRSRDELIALLAELGAPRPDLASKSQLEEGAPQLAMYLFMRQAWKLVLPEGSTDWIEEAKRVAPTGPGGGIVGAMERLLATGARPDDLTEVVRVMQWELLFNICYLLDDPGEVDVKLSDISWKLFEVDSENRPVADMSGLHEYVLTTEPTGREMRPKAPPNS